MRIFIFFLLMILPLSAAPSANIDLLPKEEIIFESLEGAAQYMIIYRPEDNLRYRIRPGIGCLRALLDPLDGVRLYLEGYGKFRVSKKRDYPYLNIISEYHKVGCKILSIEGV